MCKERNKARLPVMAYSGEIRLDKCMKQIIDFLWHRDIDTVACCCGHNKYPMTILAKTKNRFVIEIFSGKIIPRSRNFYSKDSEGYYYIPEVSGNSSHN